MAKLVCARCKQVPRVTPGLCIRCTFAVESHQERIARLDRAKAERERERRAANGGYNGNRTFPYPKVRERYRPERPYRQSQGPANVNAKVPRVMRMYGTRPR